MRCRCMSIEVSGREIWNPGTRLQSGNRNLWNHCLLSMFFTRDSGIDTTDMGEPRQVEAGPSTATLPGGFEKWRSNLSQFTGLGLTDEQKAERNSLKENETLAKDWDRCETWKKDLLERSTSSAYPLGASWVNDRSDGSFHAQTSTFSRMSIPRRRFSMSPLSYNHFWRVLTTIWDPIMSG